MVDWIFIGLGLCAVVVVVIWFFYGNKCPACGRTHAIETTSRKETRGLFQSDFEEWKCKYCDHRTWKRKWNTKYFWHIKGDADAGGYDSNDDDDSNGNGNDE